jgi:hypothetical protein
MSIGERWTKRMRKKCRRSTGPANDIHPSGCLDWGICESRDTLATSAADICPVSDSDPWGAVQRRRQTEPVPVLFDTPFISASAYTFSCLPWKEGSLSTPATYSGQQAYLAAVLETDNDLMPLRIYEALAATEQRLLSPIDAIEQKAIDDAQTGLLTLKAERIAEGKHVIHEGQQSKETY